jgi:hypothetical protein
MMGKLKNKNTLEVKASRLKIVPVGGWTWYCGYHDAYGLGDDEDEVLFMSGAHMHYHIIDGDVCELYYKEHKERKEA